MTNRIIERLARAVSAIEADLDGALSLDDLARLAHLSKFHFHRLFSAHLGVGVAAYQRERRLIRAAYRLALHQQDRVIDIALDAGFETPEAFSKAFKRLIGQTPSDFAHTPDWGRIDGLARTLGQNHPPPLNPESEYMQQSNTDIEIIKQDPITIARLRHVGSPSGVMTTAQRFVAWRKENGLPPQKAKTFNVLWDDPTQVASDAYRYDIACAFAGVVAANDTGVESDSIAGGRYARLRHQGPWEALGQAVHWLYYAWLPANGYLPDNRPLYVERVTLYPDATGNDLISDIYLPIASG